jgi:hypothetical protein
MRGIDMDQPEANDEACNPLPHARLSASGNPFANLPESDTIIPPSRHSHPQRRGTLATFNGARFGLLCEPQAFRLLSNTVRRLAVAYLATGSLWGDSAVDAVPAAHFLVIELTPTGTIR